MSSFSEWLTALIAAVIPGFGDPGPTVYNGYAEADYVYVAPESAGRIATLEVEEGSLITAEDMLFRIDDTHQVAALRAATAQVDVAKANLENLATGGREAEIDVIRASLAQGEADQRLAQSTLERSQRLLISGSISQAKVDNDTAVLQSATARVAQLKAQLEVALLPARDAQRIGAEASLEAAQAQLDDARSALADRTVLAPIDGLVDKVFYDEGEVAGAGAPVVAIFPPDQLTALFFISETDRSTVQLGDLFNVSCNGCAAGITARLTHLAASPQYTPPIIYSREERSRLVFRAEAVLENAAGLLPGQPLSLSPAK